MPPAAPREDEASRIYVVRLSEPAEAEIEAAYLRLMRLTSLSFADRWQDSLFAAIERLSAFPTSYEIAPESERFSRPVRRMLYRLGRVTYRVLFRLDDEDGDGVVDTVRILHVRHGAQQEPPPELEGDDGGYAG